MTEYLLDGKPRTGSPYGCWNAERPLNGSFVNHNHDGKIIASTVWLGSAAYEPIKCGKSFNGESLTDQYCQGCMHK